MKDRGDSLLRHLRNLFITGLLVVVPIGATAFIVYKLFDWTDSYIREALDPHFKVLCEFIFGHSVPIPPYGIGLVVTVLVILTAGMLARNLIGRRLLGLLENMVLRVPLVNRIYRAIKQISDAVLQRNKTLFREVVLVEYPRLGMYSLGFVTNQAPRVFDRLEGDSVCVFISTTPNPTSGVLIIVPRRDLIPLNISVEDGIKMVISGGVVIPEVLSQPGEAIKESMDNLPAPTAAGEVDKAR